MLKFWSFHWGDSVNVPFNVSKIIKHGASLRLTSGKIHKRTSVSPCYNYKVCLPAACTQYISLLNFDYDGTVQNDQTSLFKRNTRLSEAGIKPRENAYCEKN